MFSRNSEAVATVLRSTDRDATPSELRLHKIAFVFPGLPERNPGLKLANAFSVKMHVVAVPCFLPATDYGCNSLSVGRSIRRQCLLAHR
jgi:hypothetical protein